MLDRPCGRGDGVLVLPADDRSALLAAADDAARQGRLSKFVPASGAASRMFASLAGEGAEGDEDAAGRFLDELDRFAFSGELRRQLERRGEALATLRARREPGPAVDALLAADGLDYAATPKGLIAFHQYPAGPRTAFAEHLVEAAAYLADAAGRCRLHFTISPDHRARFAAALDAVGAGAAYRVDFSTQSRATDTLAADPEGGPFRTADGRLLFRPAGHGALIGNLEQLGGDLVLIKNIDNVPPERTHPLVARWKRLLVGHLVRLEEAVRAHWRRLTETDDPESASEAVRFITRELAVEPPPALETATPESRRRYAVDRLDRPLRVCGVVRNEGEPGGGPFWVRSADGGRSGQIVEPGQVDREDPGQSSTWKAASHFNPVDLACALRDPRGRPYELARFVDPDAAFISEKSHRGRPLRALERPGLWNGAMAGWNTVFVEVPAETFTPVKTVFDLLRPEHQPA